MMKERIPPPTASEDVNVKAPLLELEPWPLVKDIAPPVLDVLSPPTVTRRPPAPDTPWPTNTLMLPPLPD